MFMPFFLKKHPQHKNNPVTFNRGSKFFPDVFVVIVSNVHGLRGEHILITSSQLI